MRDYYELYIVQAVLEESRKNGGSMACLFNWAVETVPSTIRAFTGLNDCQKPEEFNSFLDKVLGAEFVPPQTREEDKNFMRKRKNSTKQKKALPRRVEKALSEFIAEDPWGNLRCLHKNWKMATTGSTTNINLQVKN